MEKKIVTGSSSRVHTLRRKLADLERSNSQKDEEVEELRRVCEELDSESKRLQSVVDVLRQAADARSMEMGYGPGRGDILIELAELRGAHETLKRVSEDKSRLIKYVLFFFRSFFCFILLLRI